MLRGCPQKAVSSSAAHAQLCSRNPKFRRGTLAPPRSEPAEGLAGGSTVRTQELEGGNPQPGARRSPPRAGAESCKRRKWFRADHTGPIWPQTWVSFRLPLLPWKTAVGVEVGKRTAGVGPGRGRELKMLNESEGAGRSLIQPSALRVVKGKKYQELPWNLF